MTKRTTIKDIAEALGVSVTLVSIVLSGRGREKRFSENTIELVFRTAKELGYRPNKQARSLKTNRTDLLALIVPDISNSFYGRMGRFIEEEASKNGFQLLIGSFDEDERKFESIIDRFIGMNIDGFIIVPAASSANIVKQIPEAGLPFIFMDRFLEDFPSSFIVSDNKSAAMSLTQSLVAQGAKKLAAISHSIDSTAHKHRIEGYEQALMQNGMKLDPEFIFNLPLDFKNSEMQSTIERIRSIDIDALFFTNNVLGFAGLKALSQVGCKIPEEIKVACFDYTDAFQLFNGPLWCAEQDLKTMCRKAFKTLHHMIENKRENVQLYVPVHILNPE